MIRQLAALAFVLQAATSVPLPPSYSDYDTDLLIAFSRAYTAAVARARGNAAAEVGSGAGDARDGAGGKEVGGRLGGRLNAAPASSGLEALGELEALDGLGALGELEALGGPEALDGPEAVDKQKAPVSGAGQGTRQEPERRDHDTQTDGTTERDEDNAAARAAQSRDVGTASQAKLAKTAPPAKARQRQTIGEYQRKPHAAASTFR